MAATTAVANVLIVHVFLIFEASLTGGILLGEMSDM